MKKQATKHWNDILGKGIGVTHVENKWLQLNDIHIIRILTQEDNKALKLDNSEIYIYENQCKSAINTYVSYIDLQTGDIIHDMDKRIHYKNIYTEYQCRKMYKEYSKSYFDKFEDKVYLRKRYQKAVELWDWYKNKYDGKYDFGKLT